MASLARQRARSLGIMRWLLGRQKEQADAGGKADWGLKVLSIEMTNACNLACPMCARTTSMDRPVEHMDDGMFKRLVGEAADEGTPLVWLHVFGESLLHPRVFELIDHAAARPGIRDVGLSSNGTTLDEESGRRLLDSGLTRLILSIDAFSEDVYKVVRGFDFDRVVGTVERFLRMHEESGSSMVVYLMLINMDMKDQDVERFRARWMPFERENVHVFIKPLINFGGHVDLEPMSGSHAAALQEPPSVPCGMPSETLTVLSDGRVVACCFDVNGDMAVGDAKEGLRAAWDGERLAAIRAAHRDLDFAKLPLCQACSLTRPLPPEPALPGLEHTEAA